jgi:hypothetical protein
VQSERARAFKHDHPERSAAKSKDSVEMPSAVPPDSSTSLGMTK